MIRTAKMTDLEVIDALAVKVINKMSSSGIPQWDLSYPRQEHYEQDIIDKCLFVYEEDSILGAITLKAQDDPPYNDLSNWTDEESLVIHRVIVDPKMGRKGIARQFFVFAEEIALKMGYTSIKVDTHKENYKMNGFLRQL